MDMQQFIGLGGAIVVREVVEVVKPLWYQSPWSGALNVIVAIVFGVVLNVAIALSSSTPLAVAAGLGVVTGIVASVWNKIVDAVDKGRS